MPIGAENIGTAYVRILADGEKFGDSIRDQMDDVDWDKMGRSASKEWSDNFAEEQKKAPNQKKLRDAIAGPLVRGDWLTQTFFRSKNWSNFKAGLEKEYGAAGRRAGDSLEEGLLSGMDFDSLAAKLENLSPTLVKAQKQINAELEKENRRQLDDAYRLNAEFNRKTIRLWNEQEMEFERNVADRERAVRLLHESFEQIVADTARMAKGESTVLGSKRDLIRALEDYRDGMKDAGASTKDFDISIRDTDKRLRLMNPRIERTTGFIGRFANMAGTAFGRGSRNDFINFAGAMVRGMVNILQIVPRFIGKMLEIGQSIKFAFDESMRNSGSIFRASMAAVIASLETGGAALVGFAAIAVGIVALIGPLVSIFLALAGALTAVVASISFGLIGAVAALAGALIPLAAGIGVVVAAFMSMDKEAKKALSHDFKPVVSAFKELGEVAADELFKGVGESAEVLAGVLERMEPMVRGIARSLNTVFRRAVDSLDSPEFNSFMEKWTNFLPNAVRHIGDALVNFGIGLGGVFTAAIPLIREFVGWLDDVATRFAEWATSKDGQEEIKSFLRDAAESAKALGGFLGSAAGFIGALFSAGRGTGDSLLGSLAGTLDRWAAFIRNNPDAVGEFFTNAGEVARDIGRIVEEVGHLIDILDNKGTRGAAQGLLGAIKTGLQGIATFVSPALGALLLLIQAVGRVRTAFSNMPNSLGAVRGKVRETTDAIVGFFRGLPGRIGGALSGLSNALIAKFTGPRERVHQVVNDMGQFFSELPGKIAGALAGLGVIIAKPFNDAAAIISGIPARIVGYFAGLGARIAAAIGSINIPMPNIPDVPGLPFPFATGGIVRGPTRALIGEAGAEAVVPLNRPLSQVDPAVRWLSAIAQGKGFPMAAGGVAGPSRSLSADGWTIVSNAKDPEVVAQEVFNRLVAQGY